MARFVYAVIQEGKENWWVFFGDDIPPRLLGFARHVNRSRCNSRGDAVTEAFKWTKPKRGEVFERNELGRLTKLTQVDNVNALKGKIDHVSPL
jgi:hypothetical protein